MDHVKTVTLIVAGTTEVIKGIADRMGWLCELKADHPMFDWLDKNCKDEVEAAGVIVTRFINNGEN